MRRAFRLSLVLVALLAGFVGDRAVTHTATALSHKSLQELPFSIGPWQGVSDALSPDLIAALNFDDYILRRYREKGGHPVTLYVAYYGRPRLNGRIHSPSACLPAGGWLPVEVGYQTIAVPGMPSHQISANRFLIENGLDRQIALYWFQGRGRVVANDVIATMYLAYDTLKGRGSEEMLVRVNAPVTASPSAALQDEVRFIQGFFPYLYRFLQSPTKAN